MNNHFKIWCFKIKLEYARDAWYMGRISVQVGCGGGFCVKNGS